MKKQEAMLKKPLMLGRLIGKTITGPIFYAPVVIALAPPRVAFENIFELGVRAIKPEAKVFGSIADRHKGDDAFFAHLAFTGVAAGSLSGMPALTRLALFQDLLNYILVKGDATGLESLYLQHVPTAMNRDSQDTPEVRV
jgi:hypothetical protein